MRRDRAILAIVVLALAAGASAGMLALGGCRAPGEAVSGAIEHVGSAGTAPTPADGGGAQPFDPTQLDARVTQETVGSTIGVSGYSARVRPPESVTGRIKRDLMKQHGYTDSLSNYELDHFIPLGVGGSSEMSNLWLEPIAEAERKDVDELLAHEKVTSGQWTLARGQQYIRDHWRIHYAQ